MRDLKAVWLLVAATFVVFLNETTMGVALRSIMDDLDIEAREGQWVTTAFMLTLAVVIPLTSWLIERLTTRQVFGTAMGLFCLGTVVAATAPASRRRLSRGSIPRPPEGAEGPGDPEETVTAPKMLAPRARSHRAGEPARPRARGSRCHCRGRPVSRRFSAGAAGRQRGRPCRSPSSTA